MESIVFAIISLILVIPIVYLLPFGFTRKGKLLIVLSAFLVFIVGVIARTVLNVWQTGIVIILLITGISFLLDKRLGSNLFEKKLHNEKIEDRVIQFELEDEIEEEIRTQALHKKRNILDTTQDEIATSSEQAEITPNEMRDEQLDEHMALEEIEYQQSDTNNVVTSKSTEVSNDQSFDDILKELEFELSGTNNQTYEIEELEEIKTLPKPDEKENDEIESVTMEDIYVEPETIDLDQHVDVSELNTIDQNDTELDEGKYISHEEPELEDLQFDSLQVSNKEEQEEFVDTNHVEPEEMELDSSSDVVSSEDAEVNLPNHDQGEPEEMKREDSNDIESSEDTETTLPTTASELESNPEVQEEKESSEMDTIEINEEVSSEYDTESKQEIENNFDEATENVSAQDNLESTEQYNEGNNKTRELLFTTIVSQIKLSRNQLSSTDYEKLIVDHLHPELSDHDYYTFVSLLIDHYILTKQYEKLSSLLLQNSSRFEKYPVLLQEINFLLQEYCRI
ncbi:hypothetical protein [Ferdinandcohnia sp. Marseille-Q9671]